MTKNRSTAISLPKIKTMETNAPKSKFVYPDKLYAKTNDNITLDISYAPQTLDAVEYIKEDSFIEKTKEFIWSHTEGSDYHVNYVLKEFEKYMKGE